MAEETPDVTEFPDWLESAIRRALACVEGAEQAALNEFCAAHRHHAPDSEEWSFAWCLALLWQTVGQMARVAAGDRAGDAILIVVDRDGRPSQPETVADRARMIANQFITASINDDEVTAFALFSSVLPGDLTDHRWVHATTEMLRTGRTMNGHVQGRR